ncbi:MAG: LysM peptidoglycan-binding domain-containing protein [Mariprofundaceae bacterium]|nr:LysM peptidoglycan-binding domain-containing protein [Mariprofundaceae bacterium]
MFRTFFFSTVLSLLLSTSWLAHADIISLPEQATLADLNPNIPQPYIVKKDDTLWDIANYFFKNPQKWLNIWEQNLYITNPDLIYPGNEIWFKPQNNTSNQAPLKANSHAAVFHPQPKIINKPVQRLTPASNNNVLLTALLHQDFISPRATKGVGYIVGAKDDRLHFGINDIVYLNITHPTHINDFFDVFRLGDPIQSLDHEKTVGLLVHHLGTIQIISEAQGVYRGIVTQAFREIIRGDILKPAQKTNAQISPITPKQKLSGHVLYIQNNGTAAGQNQIIGINMGLTHGLKKGMTLSVYRPGRRIKDQTKERTLTLPKENIAKIIILNAQRDASLAFVTYSTSAIHLGDIVGNSHP